MAAAAVSETISYDLVETTTKRIVESQLLDQLNIDDPFLAHWSGTDNRFRTLTDKNVAADIPAFSVKDAPGMEEVEGGSLIETPIRVNRNGTVKFISPFGTQTTSAQQPVTKARWEWSTISGTATYSQIEAARNQGESEQLNMVEVIVDDLKEALVYNLGQASMQDGTGDGGQAILGMQAIVANTNNSGTIGGINRATASNAFFRNVSTDGNSLAFDMASVLTTYVSCSLGKRRPTFMIMAQDEYESFYKALSPAERQNQNKGMANLDFEHLTYRNHAIVVWSQHVPTGTIYFLSRDWLKIYLNEFLKFKMSKWQSSREQPQVLSSTAMMDIQLIPWSPRNLGVYHSIL